MSIAEERCDDKAMWKEECIYWLDLLLGLADIGSRTFVKLLTLFLDGRYSVGQANLTHIQNKVSST